MILKLIIALTIIVALVTYGEMSLDAAIRKATHHEAPLLSFTPIANEDPEPNCDAALVWPIAERAPP